LLTLLISRKLLDITSAWNGGPDSDESLPEWRNPSTSTPPYSSLVSLTSHRIQCCLRRIDPSTSATRRRHLSRPPAGGPPTPHAAPFSVLFPWIRLAKESSNTASKRGKKASKGRRRHRTRASKESGSGTQREPGR
jgi:hypothetical protein